MLLPTTFSATTAAAAAGAVATGVPTLLRKPAQHIRVAVLLL